MATDWTSQFSIFHSPRYISLPLWCFSILSPDHINMESLIEFHLFYITVIPIFNFRPLVLSHISTRSQFTFLTTGFCKPHDSRSPLPGKSSAPKELTLRAPLLSLSFISNVNTNMNHSFVSSVTEETRMIMNAWYEEDTERPQMDVSQVFQWASVNNMFDGVKFQQLRSGGREKKIEALTEYRPQPHYHYITEENCTRFGSNYVRWPYLQRAQGSNSCLL